MVLRSSGRFGWGDSAIHQGRQRTHPKGEVTMKQSGKCFLCLLSLGLILSASETVAQDTPDKTLIVNGAAVNAAVVQVQGRSYVDIEGLAQALGGSVTFEPNQIALTIPGPPPPPAPPTSEGMTKEFQQMAVSALTEMREWRGAVGTLITTGMPVAGTWSQDYHDRVEADLMQTTLAAATEPDRQALRLLQQEFALLAEWAANVVGERQALKAARTIDPNSLQNDKSLAKISKCGQFLGSMIVSGTFSDDSSCR
jgi:hypothetical protein